MPDEVYNKPRGVRMFMYGSVLFHLDELDKAEKKQANKPKR